jgi:hypothetical protein
MQAHGTPFVCLLFVSTTARISTMRIAYLFKVCVGFPMVVLIWVASAHARTVRYRPFPKLFSANDSDRKQMI